MSNDALCKFSFFSESPSLYPFFLFYIYFSFLPLLFLFLLLFLSLVSFEMSSPPNSFGLQAHGKAKNVFYIILNHEAVWNELLGSNEPLLWNISQKQSAEAAHLKLAVCGDEEADYHICPICLFSSSPTFPFRLSPRKARCTLSFSTVSLSSLSLVSRALIDRASSLLSSSAPCPFEQGGPRTPWVLILTLCFPVDLLGADSPPVSVYLPGGSCAPVEICWPPYNSLYLLDGRAEGISQCLYIFYAAFSLLPVSIGLGQKRHDQTVLAQKPER